MSWWSEGKLKKDKEKEKADFGLDRMHKAHRRGNKRYCPKVKDHKHVYDRLTLPNTKYRYFSSEWTQRKWLDGDKEESRWFLDKCKFCGREETIHERRKI